MQSEFERLIQIINPDFTVSNKIDSDTIFYFLNSAQNRFIKLNFMSLDGLKDTTENLIKNTDAFKALIVNTELSNGESLPTGIHGLRYTLPRGTADKFFLYMRSFSYVSGTYMDIPEDTKAVVPNKLIKNEEVEKILGSYFNVPILRQPCCVLDADTKGTNFLTVYTDSYTTLKGCNLTYIRKPRKFNVITSANVVDTCELDENVHQDIVELAVEMFITEGAYRVAGGDKPWRRSQQPANTDQ